jgi:hypothetical protein
MLLAINADGKPADRHATDIHSGPQATTLNPQTTI